MKIKHQILIFVYFLCVIVITMTLFSFVLNTVITRIFGNYPEKTKMYYLEIFGIWLIMAFIILYLRTNFNIFSKKN